MNDEVTKSQCSIAKDRSRRNIKLLPIYAKADIVTYALNMAEDHTYTDPLKDMVHCNRQLSLPDKEIPCCYTCKKRRCRLSPLL